MGYFLNKSDTDKLEIVLRNLNKENPKTEEMKKSISKDQDIFLAFIDESLGLVAAGLSGLSLTGITLAEAMIMIIEKYSKSEKEGK